MTLEIISMSILNASFINFIDRIHKLAHKKQSSYICIANVHMTIEAHHDPSFAEVVNNADLVTPDGMPLVWALRLLYGIKQERVAGMDLLPELLKAAGAENLTVYFYGGTEEMMRQTERFVQIHYPQLKNVSFESPPFRPLSIQEEEECIDRINASGANLVLVALGCPKQEKWMARMKGKINACMVGIGGALPVLVGMQKRAPKWMQNAGLEWLFRLLQEPQRLFKRYFVTNSLFILLLMKQYLEIKLFRKQK